MSNDTVARKETTSVVMDPGTDPIHPEMYRNIDEIIGRYKDKPGSLIPVLQQAQDICGYLPHPVQRYIAKGLKMPPSEVFGVATFYSFFTLIPRGKHVIRVCNGTACYVKRSQEIIDKLKEALGVDLGEVTGDKRYSVEAVRCLGACGQAPVMVVGHDTYGDVGAAHVMEIIKKYE